jgi:outer membrane receptor protein involved in Fe transport
MFQRIVTKVVLIAFACTVSLAVNAYAIDRKPIEIPAGELGPALRALAQQAGVEFFYQTELVKGLHTEGVTGVLSPEEAVAKLLEGTRLEVRRDEASGALLIARPPASGQLKRSEGSGQTSEPSSRTSFWSRLRMAQRDEGAETSGDSSEEKLEEIVVTAQKREERLVETPLSMQILSADDLTKQGITQFRDFASRIPGLNFMTQGAGYSQVTLRGVTSGGDISPTVGIYVDDVPYGSSSGFASGAQTALDVGLFDVDRIEVLRGPQGTLYGASTMGGLIKYVTKRPDMNGFSGEMQTGLSSTSHGDLNYDVAAAVNAPLVADKAAVRASGFYSRDGGYIDNVGLNKEDVNASDIYGARLDLLLTPTEQLSVRLNGFLQNIDRDGRGLADYTAAGVPVNGRLDQSRLTNEPFTQHYRLASAVLEYKLGPATLTSISSYQTVKTDLFQDFSGLAGFIGTVIDPTFPYATIELPQGLSVDKFAQEVRLASNGGGTLEWLVGGFYTHETGNNTQAFIGRDTSGTASSFDIYHFGAPTKYSEYAGFANLTYHLSPAFDVSGGIRRAYNRQAYSQIGSGAFGSSLDRPVRRSNENITTYLANARYHFNNREMLYLRYATGFRPGGPNGVLNNPVTGEPLAPPTFESDSLKSYEAGFKGETADRTYGIELAVFYIDWTDIQITENINGFNVIGNAKDASIRGGELTLTARPTRGLLVTGAFAYQDAQLDSDAPALGGLKGDTLPRVPRRSAALNADYTLAESGLRPTLGGTLRYVSERHETPASTSYRLPEYMLVDLRTGLTFGRVNAQLFVRNLFDKRPQFSNTAGVALGQPRTVGISASTRF